MDNKLAKLKSAGLDIGLSAVYFTALLLSFVLLNDNFQNGENKSSFVSCLLLVLPCALDSFKDIVNTINGKKSFDILNLIIFGVLSIFSVLLVVKICTDWNNRVVNDILIYGSSLSFVKYVVVIVFQFMELFRIKFGKETQNG